MDWKTLLASIMGTDDQALLLRNEYLATEKRLIVFGEGALRYTLTAHVAHYQHRFLTTQEESLP